MSMRHIIYYEIYEYFIIQLLYVTFLSVTNSRQSLIGIIIAQYKIVLKMSHKHLNLDRHNRLLRITLYDGC